MIFVDSSVWIDYFAGRPSVRADWLDAHLLRESFCLGSLVLTEVLQGCRTDREFQQTRNKLLLFAMVDLGSPALAIRSAENHRLLRERGFTVRKTIDCLIATRCIIDRLPLLYSDRDFDPFVTHLGLIPAMTVPGVN